MKVNLKTFAFTGGFIVSLSLANVSLGADLITKDLYQGIKDAEIVTLQKFLNTSPDTTVSESGSGSIGNETDYFGSKTKGAVIRFQNKYASEILLPLGLFSGTGYVGSLTRQKINSLLGVEGTAIPVGTSTTSTSAKDRIKSIVMPVLSKIFGTSTTTSVADTTSFSTIGTSSTPKIIKVTPEILNDGDTLTIYGTGFTASNKIFLSIEPPDKYMNIPSTSDGTKISLPIKTLLSETMMTGFQNNLSHLGSSARSQVIEKLLTGYNKQQGSVKREILVPTILQVENENGKSNNITININVFKEIF